MKKLYTRALCMRLDPMYYHQTVRRAGLSMMYLREVKWASFYRPSFDSSSGNIMMSHPDTLENVGYALDTCWFCGSDGLEGSNWVGHE